MKKIKSVIVVDDDYTSNLICEQLIIRDQWAEQIHCFLNQEEALVYIKKNLATPNFPEMILLDIQFPMETGWDFLKKYEQIVLDSPPSTMICMLTSSISRSDIQRAQKEPLVATFVSKPLNSEKLEELYQKWLKLYASTNA